MAGLYYIIGISQFFMNKYRDISIFSVVIIFAMPQSIITKIKFKSSSNSRVYNSRYGDQLKCVAGVRYKVHTYVATYYIPGFVFSTVSVSSPMRPSDDPTLSPIKEIPSV